MTWSEFFCERLVPARMGPEADSLRARLIAIDPRRHDALEQLASVRTQIEKYDPGPWTGDGVRAFLLDAAVRLQQHIGHVHRRQST